MRILLIVFFLTLVLCGANAGWADIGDAIKHFFGYGKNNSTVKPTPINSPPAVNLTVTGKP